MAKNKDKGNICLWCKGSGKDRTSCTCMGCGGTGRS
jgi:RecJ-like exonuclease